MIVELADRGTLEEYAAGYKSSLTSYEPLSALRGPQRGSLYIPNFARSTEARTVFSSRKARDDWLEYHLIMV